MKKATSFRLNESTLEKLEALAKAWGISQAAVLELLVNQTHKKEKL